MSDLTLSECLYAAAGNKELVAEYDRLNGTNLSLRGAPIELMIDESSGRLRSELEGFMAFVYTTIFLPLQEVSDAE